MVLPFVLGGSFCLWKVAAGEKVVTKGWGRGVTIFLTFQTCQEAKFKLLKI